MKYILIILFISTNYIAHGQVRDFLTRNGVIVQMRKYDSAAVWSAINAGGGGGGISTIGPINSQTKSANGAVISGSNLVLQTVDLSNPGLMTSASKARLDSNYYIITPVTGVQNAFAVNDTTLRIKSLVAGTNISITNNDDSTNTIGITGTVAGTNGGTGVNNGSKTITVSGNTSIGSSTNTVTFTTSGNTSVALPTTGTLATLSDLSGYSLTSHTHTFASLTSKPTTISGFGITDGALSGANTDITSILLNQTGLVVKGGSSNALTIKPNETLSAGRTLNIITGDASRTLTFSGDATISGTNTGDQTSVSGNAGTATTLQTTRAIYGNNFDGSAALTQIIASTYGGTGNGFAKFSGPTTSEKTFTLPNASATILTDNALVTSAQGGTGNGFTKFSGPATSEKTFTLPNASSTILTDNAAVTIAQGGTGQTSAANARVALLPSLTGNTLKVLRVNAGESDVEWAAAGSGSGTVTNTGGNLTSNAVVLGAGTVDTKVVSGIVTDGTSKLTLGVAGTSVGSIDFKNATSGTVNVAPPTGALGTTNIVWPNASSTLPIFSQQTTWSGPTAARTYTLPDANATLARTDAAQTFTGQQTLNVIAPANSTTVSPIEFTPSGASLETASEQGDMEVDANGILYYSTAAAERGVLGSEQYCVLSSANTLTSQTGVQPIFDGGGGPTNGRITVAASRSYFFEMDIDITAMSSTSGTFSLAFGGTATLTSIRYRPMAQKTTGTSINTVNDVIVTSASSTAVVGANTTVQGRAYVVGINNMIRMYFIEFILPGSI